MVEERKFRLHDGKTGAAITVRIVPGADRNEVVRILGDGTVEIQLTSSNVESTANAQLIELLSGLLKVPKNQVEIVAGVKTKDKLVTIAGIDPDHAQKIIVGQVSKSSRP